MSRPGSAAIPRTRARRPGRSKIGFANCMSEAVTVLAHAPSARRRTANRRPTCRSQRGRLSSLLQAAVELILVVGLRHFLPGLHPLLEVSLIQIIQTDPREAHLIDGSLAISNPVFWIRIEPVIHRVVMPGGDVDDRAG